MFCSGLSYGGDAIFTRPNNTTAYSAGTCIGSSTSAGGGILTLVGAGPSGVAGLIIMSTTLLIGAASVPGGMTTMFLHLYNASPASAFADGDTWSLADADREEYLGSLALGTPADVGASLWIAVDNINKQIRMGGNAGGNLYAYLVTTAGFTPAAETPFRVGMRGYGF